MELTAYQSLLMKLAWPVRHLLPQFAYSVGFLASQCTKATGEHVRKLYATFNAVATAAKEGMARIIFQPVRIDKVQLVTFLDASFLWKGGWAQSPIWDDHSPDG